MPTDDAVLLVGRECPEVVGVQLESADAANRAVSQRSVGDPHVGRQVGGGARHDDAVEVAQRVAGDALIGRASIPVVRPPHPIPGDAAGQVGKDRLKDHLVGGVDADQQVAAEPVGGKRVVTPERGQRRRRGELRMGRGGERPRAESDGDGQVAGPVGGLLGGRLLRVGDPGDGFAERAQRFLERAAVDIGDGDQAGALRQRGQHDPGLVPADGGHRQPGALVDRRRATPSAASSPVRPSAKPAAPAAPARTTPAPVPSSMRRRVNPGARRSGLRAADRPLAGSAASLGLAASPGSAASLGRSPARDPSPDAGTLVIPAPSARSATGRTHPGIRRCSSRRRCGPRPAASVRRCSPTAAAASSRR